MLTSIKNSYQAITQEQLSFVLLVILSLTIALFPLGRAFQTICPIMGGFFLFFYYIKFFNKSNLVKLPIKWFILLFFLTLFLHVALSHWVSWSFNVVLSNVYRGYLLLFVALESVRKERDLNILIYACLAASLYVGIDGVWQYFTGYSFKGDAIHALGSSLPRLTASFGGYRVGNYAALMLLPSFGLWYVFKSQDNLFNGKLKSSILLRLFIFILLISPGIFIWAGAQARSGYLAIVGGVYFLFAFILFKPRWYSTILPVAIGILVLFFGPKRLSWEHAMGDGRIKMWAGAWQTFLHSPWFGYGAATFKPAHELAVGHTYVETNPILHPHNVYLQWLTEGGIVTFILFATFFATMSIWTFIKIRKGIIAEKTGMISGLAWHKTAFFWAGFFGYQIINFAGHSFYRTWIVAMGLIALGITLSACLNNQTQKED